MSSLLAVLSVVVGGLSGISSFDDSLTAGQRSAIIDCVAVFPLVVGNLERQFPSRGFVPDDHPDVVFVKNCQGLLNTLLNSPGPADNEEYRNLIKRQLQDVGTCTIQKVQSTRAEAGLSDLFFVGATVPFANAGAIADARMTLRGSQFSAGLSPIGVDGFFGQIFVPDFASQDAAGEVSPVVVTASSPIGPPVDGVCPAGSTPAGGQCIVSCTTAPTNVVWITPETPEIELFLVAPSTIDPANPTPIGLTWSVKNAKSVSIDQGVGEVDKKTGIVFEFPPDKDTTYTLTAFGPRPENTRTATQKVTVKSSKPLTVSINSPGGNSNVTSNSVAVTGTVFPAPSGPGSMTATISVNGVPKQSVPVDSAGNFSGAVALAKTTNPSFLNLVNPNLGVGGCGDRSTAVVVQNFNTQSDVENVIAVTVTDGSQQGSASVAVFHAVRLFDFVVEWLSCPPINKNEERNIVLGPQLQQFIGTVDCGCNNAPGGCNGSCTVQASVATSLGILFDNATWTFNVAGPCP